MNYSRTALLGKCLFDRNAVSVSGLNAFKHHDFRGSRSALNEFLLRPDFNAIRIICRHRYSFIYSKKISSVLNSKLSSVNSKRESGSGAEKESEETPLTKCQATELVLRLTEEERKFLLSALNEYDSNQVKAEYEAEQVPMPTTQQLLRVAVFNAVPFVGFGFLDNFIMIVAGDYIDETVGSIVTISTMAAAALGNTISDVMGIGSAWYVELAASKIGLKAPNLSPIQLDMKPARRSANLGRAFGIIVGCLLGMIPLLFISKEDKKSAEHEKQRREDETTD